MSRFRNALELSRDGAFIDSEETYRAVQMMTMVVERFMTFHADREEIPLPLEPEKKKIAAKDPKTSR